MSDIDRANLIKANQIDNRLCIVYQYFLNKGREKSTGKVAQLLINKYKAYIDTRVRNIRDSNIYRFKEDLTNELCIQLLIAARSFKVGRGASFKTYFTAYYIKKGYRQIRSEFSDLPSHIEVDSLNQAKPSEDGDELEIIPLVDDTDLLRSTSRAEIKQGILSYLEKRLPLKDFEIISAWYTSGAWRTAGAASAKLNIPYSAYMRRLSRILKTLRRDLRDYKYLLEEYA